MKKFRAGAVNVRFTAVGATIIAFLPGCSQFTQQLYIPVRFVQLSLGILEGAEFVLFLIRIYKSVLKDINNPQVIDLLGGLIDEVVLFVAFIGH